MIDHTVDNHVSSLRFLAVAVSYTCHDNVCDFDTLNQFHAKDVKTPNVSIMIGVLHI